MTRKLVTQFNNFETKKERDELEIKEEMWVVKFSIYFFYIDLSLIVGFEGPVFYFL